MTTPSIQAQAQAREAAEKPKGIVTIVCNSKRNHPRMDVRVCEQKCNLRHGCTAYVRHLKGEV